MTLRLALLGQPVAHSPSPRVHEAFGRQFSIGLSYEKIEVAPEDFAAVLARLHEQGYAGANITVPHKLAAFEACAESSPAAALAKAVNTLVRLDSGWRGENTDGAGLIRDLKDNLKLRVRGSRVLLLGAGGAARGILKPLLDEQPAELTLSNRNPWKPEQLAAEFKDHGSIRPCTHTALKGDTFDLVINATSAGHGGNMVRLPGQLLAKGGACYDLSYGKAFEPFRAWAGAQGAGVVADGIGMLVEQAAVSFESWTGKRPETAPVIAELREVRA